MADAGGDRTKHFPAIEKKHGGPISIWLERVAELGDVKYPEQIALLRENHGFSQVHANAVVMYSRNSPSSRRFKTADEYFASLEPASERTARAIFAAISVRHPDLDLVVAWNHPMLRSAGGYVFGLSAARHHLLLNPFSADVVAAFAPQLQAYEVNKHTIRIPIDWAVDEELLGEMVAARLAELS